MDNRPLPAYETRRSEDTSPESTMLRPGTYTEEKPLPITQPLMSAAEVQEWLGLGNWASHELLGIVQVPLKDEGDRDDTTTITTGSVYIFQAVSPGPKLSDCSESRPTYVGRIARSYEVTVIDEVSLDTLRRGNYSDDETAPYREIVLQPGQEQIFGRGMDRFSDIWNTDTAPVLSHDHFKVGLDGQSGQVVVSGHSPNGTFLTYRPEPRSLRGQPAAEAPVNDSHEALARLTDLRVEHATVASQEHAAEGINHDAIGSAYTPGYHQASVVVVDGVSNANRPQAITPRAAQELAERSANGQNLLVGLPKVLQPVYGKNMDQWRAEVLSRKTDGDDRRRFTERYQRERQRSGGEFTFIAATLDADDNTITVATPIVYREDRSVTGDSCALLVRDNHLYAFPVANSLHFDGPDALRPATVLVSPPTPDAYERSAVGVETVTFTRKPGDTLIVATDGLAAWIMSQYEMGNYSMLNRVLAAPLRDFPTLVAQVRDRDPAGFMKDDVTCVKISDGTASINREDGSGQRVRLLQELANAKTKRN